MFRLLVEDLPVLLIELAPVWLLLVGYLRWRRLDPATRRRACWLLLLVIVFDALDLALLEALPRLGLSFGPTGAPLAVLWFLRLAFLVAWMFLSLPVRTGRALLLAAQFLLTAGLVYSFYIEPFDVRVTQLELDSPAVRPGQRLRIVQLSDIHVERTTPRERKVIAAVQSLQPDIIVLTGDYLNNSYSYNAQAEKDLRWLVSQLHAPYGIYAVNGSAEAPARTTLLFYGLDVTLLQNATRTVQTPAGDLTIIGINDVDHSADIQALEQAAGKVPRDAYSLLIYHNPDLIQTAAGLGIDLYLAGHTHGGQIRVPFYGALMTFSIYGKQFEQGLYNRGGTTLYVSRGLGMEGKQAPRARFLAPPEVVSIDLTGH